MSMTASESVGSVASLWRFPVKSMGGESIDAVDVTSNGLIGDRAYALIDAESGKVVSAKSVRLFPGVLNCRATFVEPPRVDREPPPVRISLPSGQSITSDAADANHRLSDFFGRAVRLAGAAPPDFTIDQYHPDVEDADPAGYRDVVVEQKLGAAFFRQAGMASPVSASSFFDLYPISVLTTSALARWGELAPASRFEPRRFRMNVIVRTSAAGCVENEWVGREVAFGDHLRLRVAMPDPRCVMTTLAQGDLPQDAEILRTLVRHNRLQVGGGADRFPCAGVYSIIQVPGTLRVGDRVTVV
jgi:uncharacterized protein YcbX